jgi:hypothetical protein
MTAHPIRFYRAILPFTFAGRAVQAGKVFGAQGAMPAHFLTCGPSDGFGNRAPTVLEDVTTWAGRLPVRRLAEIMAEGGKPLTFTRAEIGGTA